MSRQALGLQGERWKNGRNARFFSKENNECLPNFEVFNENKFLETSNGLQWNFFIYWRKSKREYNKKDLKSVKETIPCKQRFLCRTMFRRENNIGRPRNLCLQGIKETTAVEEIPAEELNKLLCHLFVKVKVRKRNPSFLKSRLQQMHNCCRSEISTVISSKTTRGYWFGRRWMSLKCIWIVNELLFNFVWLDFRVLFVLSSSFFS